MERYADQEGLLSRLSAPDVQELTRLVPLENRTQGAISIVDGQPQIRVVLPNQRASRVGTQLADLDREVRRTTATLQTGVRGSALYGFRNILRSDTAGIALTSASIGSFDLLAGLYGRAAAVFLSSPVQMMITLQWLWDRRPSQWGSGGARALVELPTFAPASARQRDRSRLEPLTQTMQAGVRSGRPMRARLTISRDGDLTFEMEVE